MQAVSDGKLQKEHVPKVHLHATHDAALKEVECKDLRQYAAPSEAGGSNRQEAHHNPASGGTSVAKEHHEISSHGKWAMVGESCFQKCSTDSSFFFLSDKSMAPGSASSMNKTGSVSDTSAPRG